MGNKNEIEWVEYIRTLFSDGKSRINEYIGDDCVELPIDTVDKYLVSSDMMIENVHFSLEYFSFEEIARRILAVNLSDIAAMGGIPLYIVLDLGIPAAVQERDLELFFISLKKEIEKYDVKLIGGDLNKSTSGLIISLTIIGKSQGETLLRRKGARKGDLVYVTGTLGDSKLGLYLLSFGSKTRIKTLPDGSKMNKFEQYLVSRHKVPEPRVQEGQILASKNLATAAIDVSDGLVLDLDRLSKESNATFIIELEHLPISEAVKQVASLHELDPIEIGVSGGEDLELLFTVNPAKQKMLGKVFHNLETKVTCIGKVTGESPGVQYKDFSGTTVHVPTGYLHF